MSIWKNGKLVAGGSQALPLLTFVWADHILDNISWLRADTFSWQSGSVYQAVYQHLANDIDGKSLQSETIGSTTIQFYLADDGHKICPASEESNVVAIYNATGVAWYYIIDTVNERFKLPRTKFGFTGLRDNVGKYVAPGAPDITSGNANVHTWYNDIQTWEQGAFKKTATNAGYMNASVGNWTYSGPAKFKASFENSIYGASDTIQPPATQMYLYFYVGAFTQTALENTAGVVTEDFNELNAHKVIEFQAPTAENNYTWYRKYADGWVEQGGKTTQTATSSVDVIITLPVEMQDTEYTVTFSVCSNVANDGAESSVLAQTVTTISLHADSMASASGTKGFIWEVKGMAA